jgi:all-beta uncharacterized protein/BACON domain-containing protein
MFASAAGKRFAALRGGMRARLFFACCLSAVASVFSACGSSSISVTAPTAPKCQVAVANSLSGVPASGAAGELTVTTARDCTWSASSGASWVTLTSASTGQGSGSVAYRVAENADPTPRNASVDVNGQKVSIAQDPAPCRFVVTPSSAQVAGAGGAVKLQIQTNAACTWTASSGVDWITPLSTATGRGAAAVTFNVAPNAAPTGRQAAVTVAGQSIVVSQSADSAPPPPPPDPGPTPPPPGPCTFSIDPANSPMGASGGTEIVSVTAGSGCAWTAQSETDWLSVTSGATGVGSGSVTIRAGVNTGASRTGTATIAGHTFTVSQTAAACNYNINPTSQSVGAAGADATITVTAGSICGWTAQSNAPWITVTDGSSGTGNGTVAFTVAQNSAGARSGTIAVAGRTFNVTQAASPCTFSISPTSQTVEAGGGAGAITLTTRNLCNWTATSGAPWLSVTSTPHGSGGGTVTFSAAANTGPARSGTLTIGGQTFTVNQAAQVCSFSIAPPSQAVDASGGTGTIAVTAGAGCGWTASASAPWISVTGGSPGSGNGSVTFTVAPNGDPAPRSATITIGGQTFTVNQGAVAPCSFTIAPGGQAVDPAGGGGSVAVTAGPSCAWTAVSNADWIAIASLPSGTGNGGVDFTAAANGTGAPRSGTITIAGQIFTVTQAAPVPVCTYSVAPPSIPIDAGGGFGGAIVTTGPSCAWTAVPDVDWIVLTTSGSGTGNGGFAFAAGPNTSGAPRSGTITVAGQPVTVTQGVPGDRNR